MVTADSGANLSDHRALVCHFWFDNLAANSYTSAKGQEANTVLPAWRWDKADTSCYYEACHQTSSAGTSHTSSQHHAFQKSFNNNNNKYLRTYKNPR